ncbi:leucine-rich repeat domain-containing protein [Bythopirellula goksoeyrii]|uniref:Leucine Rich repeats (2 copies) n=1 Tax=Bythopirellula goksoeyrii TaxID=1400387 RepID=A0A5B9QFY7_9BACT|nr:hypothetical protein [Bythopirellula goksoeyrii]QEG36819.1 Leucine Rich repeats (2 copies) [Bythopirellula goksoeyrii]
MSVEQSSNAEASNNKRTILNFARSLLKVFVITVPLYVAGIAALSHFTTASGLSLGSALFLIWVGATITWIIAELISCRSIRFGMKTILTATTVLALLCFLAVHHVRPYMSQRQAIAILKSTGVRYESQAHAPAWLQRLTGPENCQVVTAVQGHQQSRLEDNLMECISASPHLYELFIGNSLITDAGLRHIKGMNNLLAIDLPSGPDVSNACLAHLPAMKQLNWIDASDVPVKDEGLAYLSTLTQIEQIELNRCQITDAGLMHLRRLTNLRRLVLDNNEITDDGLKHIQPLTKLVMLSLEDTQITDDGLKLLQDFDNLQYLRLSGTSITDDGLKYIARLKNSLRALEIENTQITDEGLRKEQMAFSHCTIINSKLPQGSIQRRTFINNQMFNGYLMYRQRTSKLRNDPYAF